MTDETETSLLTAEEQAWLDACPPAQARSLTKFVGQLGHVFTVDKRHVSSPLPRPYGPHGTESKGY